MGSLFSGSGFKEAGALFKPHSYCQIERDFRLAGDDCAFFLLKKRIYKIPFFPVFLDFWYTGNMQKISEK